MANDKRIQYKIIEKITPHSIRLNGKIQILISDANFKLYYKLKKTIP